jgi:drug/metabolite transporter (DMT)-like permease
MKRGLEVFTPQEVAAYRISAAMLVLLPFSLSSLKTLQGNFLPILASGIFGNGIPAFLFAFAQTEIPSGLSGILNSLTSLFTLIIGILFFRVATLRFQIAGVVLALIGALGLIGFSNLLSFGQYGRYASLIVIAAACYGIAVNIIKFYLHEIKPAHITSLSFLMLGPGVMVYLIAGTEFVSKLQSDAHAWNGLIYLTILGVVGTAIAVIIFNRLIKETTAVFASSVTYLIPIVAVAWGLLDGEQMTWDQVLFMGLILLGIFLINSAAPGRFFNRLFR